MAFTFSSRSRKNLQGVHPDLVRVAERALQLTPIDFVVTEGVRTLATQRRYVAAGASRTMKSRHLTGHAIDVAALIGRSARWELPLYRQINAAFQQASRELGVPVQWGGTCFGARFIDGPHFQLPHRQYPA